MMKLACAGALLAAVAWVAPPALAQVCKPITTPVQLHQMRTDLAGSYCLKNDLDMSAFGDFVPVGRGASAFTGTFDGENHVIRNLTINDTVRTDVALFGSVSSAIIRNVSLVNASVTGSGSLIGLLVGTAAAETAISNVQVGGIVSCTNACTAGGIAGQLTDTSALTTSSSAANVDAPNDSTIGGVVGAQTGESSITRTYATGRVSCGDTCRGGGVAGLAGSKISRAFSSGPVYCGFSTSCGGFAGQIAESAAVSHAYATGRIHVLAVSRVAGFAASLNESTVRSAYAVGLVGRASGSQIGGFIALNVDDAPATNAYWDTQTTGVDTSSDGTPRTTAQLRDALPAGFAGNIWGITPRFSYPFLLDLEFRSTLATLVVDTNVFTFVPVSQLEKSNYKEETAHIDQASLATCYTMIARAIGNTMNDAALQDIKTDKYFWRDAGQRTFWRGPVTDYATLGTFATIGRNAPLNTVIAQMRQGNLVLLRGSYQDGGQTAQSWMLGTLFTSDEEGAPTAIYANDPFTGKQVVIDYATKTVVTPDFPLTNFKVDGYQPVTINAVN